MKPISHAVVDTNILLIANEQHEDISPAGVIACVERLEHLRKRGRIVLDDGREILREYGHKTTPNTGNRVGDAFLKWIYQNMGNPQRVELVHIERHQERGYAEFPEDPELLDFDPEDKKFIAVAVAHPKHPIILQGSDSKWTGWSERLRVHSIRVEFLCRDDVERFGRRKRLKKP